MLFLSSQLSIEVIDMDRILKDPNLLSTCRQLSHGGSSGMNCALDHYQGLILSRSVDAKGVFARHAKDFVGWALVTRETDDYYYKAQPGHACFQVFVKHDFRRPGIGRKLLREAKNQVPNETLFVYSWSNTAFFSPMIIEGVCQSI